MAKVKVVTCSASCIPRELAEELGIEIVPLVLIVDGREYRDGIDISTEELYTAMMVDDSNISTATPTTGAFLRIFNDLAPGCDEIVCITLASRFSAEYLAAANAADAVRSVDVTVLDSGTAATAQGQVVVAAARAAAEGSGSGEVLAAARDVAGRVQLFAAVETLRYLKHSGRLGPATAFAGEALSIKPVFRLAGGSIRPVAKELSRKRALERIVREAAKAESISGPLHLAFFHAASPDDAIALKENVERTVEHVESYLTDITPVMGRHTGPGLVGASFY